MSNKSLPDHVTMGLLDLISRQALDQDYVETALRRAAAAETGSTTAKRSRGVAWAAGLANLCLAMLVVTAVVQRIQTADERDGLRKDLAGQVQLAQNRLEADRDRIEALTVDNQAMRDQALGNDAAAQKLLRRTGVLQARSGLAAVAGPGVRLTVDNATFATRDAETVLDSDLQRVVNGLFASGAEAVAINDQRITPLTSIRTAGGAIQVNYRPQHRPYVIKAIGDPRTLAVRFARSPGGQEMQAVKEKYGLRFDNTTSESLQLPAALPPTLRYATQANTSESRVP